MKRVYRKLLGSWIRFWMHFTPLGRFGRIASLLSTWFTPPYKSRLYLARYNSQGYIAPSASIRHADIKLAGNVFIGDRVVIHQINSGSVELGEGVHLYSDIIIETGEGGRLTIGTETHVQPRCQLMAYLGSLQIGRRVEIAPNCALYPYNHGIAPEARIRNQPCTTKGGIVVGDDAWLGVGVIVLDGVRIGKGAVIGAGSVVTKNVPDGAIAFGVPARVVKMRSDLAHKNDRSSHLIERGLS